MKKKQQTLKIETKSLYKTLIRVALPIALQSLIATSLNLVDNLMVGSLGEAELAAVGLSNQLFFVYMGVMFGLSSGSATFISQFWGIKDLQNIRKVLGFAVTVSLIAGMIFFVPAMFFPARVLRVFTDIPEAVALGKEYLQIISLCLITLAITMPCTAALRATQQTKIPMFISLLVFSTNTLLNYLLIFGKFGLPAMGVKGAAIATLIARLLETGLVLYAIFNKNNVLSGKLTEFFRYHKTLAVRVLKNSLPITANEVIWSLGMVTYNAFYGRMGVTEFAAIQASNTINNLFIMVGFSMGDAVLILVGQRIGMGQMDYAFALGKRLLRISTIIGAVTGLLLILTSPLLAGLFNFTAEGHKYTLWILMIYGIMMWIKLYNGISVTGTLRCGGDTKFAMILEGACVWGIGVPLAFVGVFIFRFPIYIVVLMVQTEEFIKGLICRHRFYSKKWLNNLIQDI